MEKTTLKQFNTFVIPSIISALFISLYTVLDGIFIGRQVGEIGLAGINFAFPIAAFIQSVGFGIGLSGAIKINIVKGRGEDSRHYIGATYFCFILAIAILMPLLMLFKHQILNMFGATNPDIHKEAINYINIVLVFLPIELLSQGLIPLLRSHGYNKYCMSIVSIGYLINLILEYVFLYPMKMGLPGVAWSVIIGQGFVVLTSVLLLLKKEFIPSFKNLLSNSKEILKSGFSSFGLAYSSNLITIIINKSCSIYASELAISAYTAMSYITYMIQKLVQAIADGIQPILSFAKGSNNKKEANTIYKLGLILAVSLAAIATFVCIVFDDELGALYKLKDSLPYFESCATFISLSFVFVAISRISMAYFNSSDKNLYSNTLIYLEPFFVLVIAMFFPKFMGTNGIWSSFLISDLVLTFVIITFLIIEKRSSKIHIAYVEDIYGNHLNLYFVNGKYFKDRELKEVFDINLISNIYTQNDKHLEKNVQVFNNNNKKR